MKTDLICSEPIVSIVIRCFNEEKHIGNLLKRIQEQRFKAIEVVIVDSGSTDWTLSIVRRYPVKLVQINPEEFTFGYSLNQGCSVAKGKFLVIASAHVLPTREDWIAQLLSPFQDPRVALVYGRQVGGETTKFSEHQVFKKMFSAGSNFHQIKPFCSNANAAIPRAFWKERPFDETLTGLEDLDWAKWAIEQGHVLAYNVLAEVIHIHEETAQIILNRYMREAIALRHIFPDAHMNFWEFLLMLGSNIGLDLLRAVWERRFWSHAKEIIIFRCMQYWGTYKGMRYRSPVTKDIIRQFYYPRKIVHLKDLKHIWARTKMPHSGGME